MTDDVAAIVIMLSPPPVNQSHTMREPPPNVVRASINNVEANSPAAKAARDGLAAVPYQNFFKHLDLVSCNPT